MKLIFTAINILLWSFVASASFLYNGVWYTVTDPYKRLAGVDGCSYNRWIVVPNTVAYDGKIYTVVDILPDAFKNNTLLNGISLNDEISYIGRRAFQNCQNLSSVNIPPKVKYLMDNTFEGCNSLRSITIPPNVSSIGKSCFSNCSRLESVTIPPSVTSIEDNAFGSNINLTTVNITDLSAWCKIKFSNTYANPAYYAHGLILNNKKIVDLEIPEGVTSIGDYAFKFGKNYKTVSLPSTLQYIGEEAFLGCTNMKRIDCYAEKPPTLASGTSVFSDVAQYIELHVLKSNYDAYKNSPIWQMFNIIPDLDDSNGVVDIEDNSWKEEYYNVYDLNGNLIMEKIREADTRDLPSGVFIMVSGKDSKKIFKK